MSTQVNLGDNITKILLTLITAALIGSASLLISLRNDYTAQNVELKNIREMVQEIKNSNSDYLTKYDFDNKMESIIQQVNQNSRELNDRSSFIDNTRNEITELKYRVKTLENER